MANDINLKSGNGITIDLSLSDKSLSIKINSNQLDKLIEALLNNKNSAVYKKLKSILESTDITVGKAAYAAKAANADNAANANKLNGKDSSAFANASHTHPVAKHTHKVAKGDIEDLKYGSGDKSGTIFIKYK